MKRFAIPLGVVGFGILLCICIFGGKALFPSKPEPLWTRAPTRTPWPTSVTVAATATSIVWVLEVPHSATQGLWTVDVLTDEQCWDCSMGDLESGILLRPGPGGCQASEWDPTYVYCNVEVLSGDLAGQWGWVNETHIAK